MFAAEISDYKAERVHELYSCIRDGDLALFIKRITERQAEEIVCYLDQYSPSWDDCEISCAHDSVIPAVERLFPDRIKRSGKPARRRDSRVGSGSTSFGGCSLAGIAILGAGAVVAYFIYHLS